MPDDNTDDVTFAPMAEDGESEAEGSPEQKLKSMRDKLRAAEAEASSNLAGWQRAKADYINLQKRMRDSELTMGRAGTLEVLAEMISIFDSLEAASRTDESSGLLAVVKQVESILSRHGVTRYEPTVGNVFDPNLHEPVQTVATKNKVEDNTIQSVLQSGFMMDGIALRPARVILCHFEA